MPDISEVDRELRQRQLQEIEDNYPWNYNEAEPSIQPKAQTEDLVARAERFAGERHAGQLRKDNSTPYIVHPAGLVASLKQCGIDDSCILAAAWLHDTVEDTNTTLDEIYDEFGQSVCGLVDALTRRKPLESHDIYNSRVLSNSHAARLIKVTDTEHNMRTIECLDDEAQERKLREAKEVYLPLRDELCALYDCAPLFNALEEHVKKYEAGCQKYLIVRQEWLESERGWGQRPDGYSFHLTLEDCRKFIEAYWERMPDKVPECYSRPYGSAEPYEAEEDLYKKIKESEHGIRKWK